MTIIGYDNGLYKLRCEKCDSLIDVKAANCFIQYGCLRSKLPIICACGNRTFDLGENPDATSSSISVQKTTESDHLEVRCPKCQSRQLTTTAKGFRAGKAVAGAVLVGPIGLLGGFLGSNKVIITCMKCGHRWQPEK